MEMATLQGRQNGIECGRSSQMYASSADIGQLPYYSSYDLAQQSRPELQTSVTDAASPRSETPLVGNAGHLAGVMARCSLDGSSIGQAQVAQQLRQVARPSHHQPVTASQPLYRPTAIPPMNVVDFTSAPRPPVQAPRTPSLPPPESSSVVSIYPSRSCHKQPNSVSPPNYQAQPMQVFSPLATGPHVPSTRPSSGATRLAAPFVQTNSFLQSLPTSHSQHHSLSVLQQPTSKTIMAGCSAKLSYRVQDHLNRDIHYQWFFGQHQLLGMTSPYLLINNASAQHDGLYICRAMVADIASTTSPKGLYLFSDWAKVQVTEQQGECPTILIQPCPVIAHYGHHVELRCEATGTPPPSYQWYHNGYLIEGETGSLLRIEGATERHSGYYSCKVENDHGGRASNIVQVHIHMSDVLELPPKSKDSNAPRIIQHPQSHQVEHGGCIQLSCSAEGVEPFRYQWYKDNVPLSETSAPVHAIRQCGESDSGLYICHISNMYGEQWSNPARVLVKEKPVTPAVVWPTPATCTENQWCSTIKQPNSQQTTASNGCYSTASVATAVSSLINSSHSPAGGNEQGNLQHSIVGGSNRGGVVTTCSLSGDPVADSCAVDFRCDSQESNVQLPPLILTHPPSHLSIPIGESLSLVCEAKSLCGQMLSFQWLKDSCLLQEETRPELRIRIDHVSCAGTYVCQIANGGQPAYSHPCCVYVSGPGSLSAEA